MYRIYVHVDETCVGQNKVAKTMRAPPRATTRRKAVVAIGVGSSNDGLRSGWRLEVAATGARMIKFGSWHDDNDNDNDTSG